MIAEELGAQESAQKPAASAELDVRATNQILECFLALQNQVQSWSDNLEQTATIRADELTPAQRETVSHAVEACRCLCRHLQELQPDLTK